MQLTGEKRRARAAKEKVMSHCVESEQSDCIEGAELILGLRMASWADTASSAPSPRSAPSPLPVVAESEEERSDADEEYRPSKVRVIHTGSASGPIILPRRSYTWRGASRRQQPQEGGADSSTAAADSQHHQHHQQQQPAVSAATQQQQQPAPAAQAAAGSKADTKEGDKEWAALTTWLRMNLHNPRTAKKVVLFVGQQDAEGQWSFDLNPALTWGDVSLDTKLRLRDIATETQAAFHRKYPARPGGDWRKKAQRYRPPGSAQTYQVPLGQLVVSLHDMYARLESSGAAPAGSSGSDHSALTTGQRGAASPTHSHCS